MMQSAQQTIPQPDKAAILGALAALFNPEDVIELRALHKTRKRTDAGYFDGKHREALADLAMRLNAKGAAVYVTLNQIDPQLLGRYSNRLEEFAVDTATDANVKRRRWLLIDLDPLRPKDTAATDMQLAEAKAKATACYRALKAQGWPEPLAGESGNGWHLIYPLDLPNDADSRDLVKGALAGLAARFDDDVVKVDQSVYNAARITKLYGTVATKGDHTPLAPWRLSRLVSTPERGAVVTVDQLRAWHPADASKQSSALATHGTDNQRNAFDLAGFMARLGIAYEQDSHEGTERYKLAQCPFNPEHGKGEAAIFRQPGGRLGFKCQHNSCAERTWQDVRALIDGARETRQAAEINSHGLENGKHSSPPKNASADIAEPEPLRAALPPAEPYPVDSLGDILGGAAKALHDSVKVPLAMCGQSVLAAASLAAQAHYDVMLPWGELKPLSLFLLTVGESGERKSGVDNLVLSGAKAQERAEMEAYARALERHEGDMGAWTQASDAARKAAAADKKGAPTAADIRAAVEGCGEKPTAPVAPLRFVTDPTVEGLYKLLATGQPSVALFSDEGGLLIGGHALNSDNALKTMARWCKLWDGAPFDRVRAGDGSGILYGRRMALHQLAQPDVMVSLLSDRLANGQGFLARCLVAWPESTIGTRHVKSYEWAGDRDEMKKLFAVLKSRMEAKPRTGQTEQELDPKELPLSEDAKALAVAAGNQFETLMAKGADLAELRDRAAKALENACRIAGVLAVVEGDTATEIIKTKHLERALVLVQWYLAEALRIRGAAAVPRAVLDAEMLSTWLKEKGVNVFRTKRVLHAGPNPLRNKPRLIAAITELVTCGYLAENDSGTVVDGVKARRSWRVLHHVV